MATIDSTGITPTSLEAYRERVRDVFRSILGDGTSFDPETPQEQIAGTIGLAMSEQDEVIVRAYQALNIFRSAGLELDGHGAALSIPRRVATRTLVPVTLAGVAGTNIPAGTRARTDAGDRFRTREAVQIPAGGSVAATMESEETGAIPAPAGGVAFIVDVVPGWETVTNAAAGTLGRDAELDGPYLRRYFLELFGNARSPLESIIAAVSDVDNVIEVAGVENDTTAAKEFDSVSVSAHSVAIVVQGGLDADVVAAIANSKTGGTGTDGTTTLQGPNVGQIISFYRADLVPLAIDLDITLGAGFPADGVNQIRQRLVEYFTGTFSGGVSQFETDGVRIGEDVRKFRLYTPLNAVPGYDINSFVLRRSSMPGEDVETIAATLIQKLTIAESNINITVT